MVNRVTRGLDLAPGLINPQGMQSPVNLRTPWPAGAGLLAAGLVFSLSGCSSPTKDSDHDGLLDRQERKLKTDPRNPDTDGDDLPDALEVAIGLDPRVPATSAQLQSDTDGDGITLMEELKLFLDPTRPDDARVDSDQDLMTDVWEVRYGLDPRQQESLAVMNSDEDGDDLLLAMEARAGTDPKRRDTDGDGMDDNYEVRHETNPVVHDGAADPDGDGLSNFAEYRRGTDPQDYYNGADHEILPFPPAGQPTAAGFMGVRVVDKVGNPMVNAPVIFTVPENEGNVLALTPDGPVVGREAEVRTGPGGIAKVYVRKVTASERPPARQP